MSTNFYWAIPEICTPLGDIIPIDRDDPVVHIGKRSAAGKYCWDCDETLCVNGESEIHYGTSKWHTVCPVCKIVPLTYACSFTWAQNPHEVLKYCRERGNNGDLFIEDEYGRRFTGDEFLQMLENSCPIHFYDMINRQFS